MRPHRRTPAHTTDAFGELVCSNSLKSESENSAPWLRETVAVHLCYLFSKDHSAMECSTGGEPADTAAEVRIDPAIETGCGLRYPSVVSCNNLLTIDQGLIVQAIGRVSPATMQQIDDRLKTALGLP